MGTERKDYTYAFIIKEIINSQSQLNLQELMLQQDKVDSKVNGVMVDKTSVSQNHT
jgi:hypothetical protein